MNRFWILGTLVLCAAHTIYAPNSMAQGRLETLQRTGDAASDGNGQISAFWRTTMNDNGEIAFFAELENTSGTSIHDNFGVYSSNGNQLTQHMRGGELAPDGTSVFSGFDPNSRQFDLSISNAGMVGFASQLDGENSSIGYFTSDGSSQTQLVRTGNQFVLDDPNDPYTFEFLGGGNTSFEMNNAGRTVFRGFARNADGDIATGLFTPDNGSFTPLVYSGQPDPSGTRSFGPFNNNPKINAAGDIVFHCQMVNAPFDIGYSAFTLSSDGQFNEIARRDDLLPGGNGTYGSPLSTHINDHGEVAFISFDEIDGEDLRGIHKYDRNGVLTEVWRQGSTAPSGDPFANMLIQDINNQGQVGFWASTVVNGNLVGGLYRDDHGQIKELVRQGDATPDGDGTIRSIYGRAAMHDGGSFAFFSYLDNTSGGADEDFGLFLTDGIDLIEIIREGDSIDGSTVVGLNAVIADMETETKSPYNIHGQIGFITYLADERQLIQRYTPTLNWRTGVSGNWNDTSNWTLGLNPAHVHDVNLTSDSDLFVQGPDVDTQLRTLTIGGGNGKNELVLNQVATLTVSEGLEIQTNGTLSGSGLIVGDVNTNGVVDVGMSAGILQIDGNLTAGDDSLFHIELGGTSDHEFDRILVSGDVSLNGNLTVDLINGFQLSGLQEFTFLQVDGILQGQFNSLGEGALVTTLNNQELFITYAGGDGNDVAFFSVPEPASGFLLLTLAGMSVFRRRRST